ncbi:hypothetical protein WOLCODRAFT_158883 [Wolfiporia cocos MD-104 SS10]|uniref:Uncharacterized protein n=1 Tax=Wolfiporia cocos (strain MD-104) TaxID=742152 RepID=A0A2H3JNL2_WOLCO|nr:hypothetical protein WOLCODRAFT_158883 [Wolfiporia cocos MD-104 SS10]
MQSERCPSTSQGAVPAINRARQRRLPYQPRPWIGRPPAAPCPARLPAREDQRAGDRLCVRARRLGNGASTWVASNEGPPSALEQRRASRQAGYSPSAHGGTVRLNNRDLRRCSGPTTKHPRLSVDPRGNPARAIIERGAASAQPHWQRTLWGIGQPQSKRAPRRTPPAATRPPRSTVAHQRKAIRQGQPPESYDTAASHSHRPPSVLTQGRAQAYHRQGNPPRTESNSGADRLNNRATPSADRALNRARSRHAARQRGSPGGGHCENTPLGPTACRTSGNDQAPRTGQSPPLRRTRHRQDRERHRHQARRQRGPGPSLLDTSRRRQSHSPSGQGISLPRQCHRLSGPLRHRPRQAASDATRPRLLPECRELAQQCDAKPRAPCQGTHKGRGGDIFSPPSKSQESEETPPNALGNRLTANRYRPPWIATPSPPLKQRRRPGKQASHVHDTTRSPVAPDTSPSPSLSQKQPPRTGVKMRAHLRQVP